MHVIAGKGSAFGEVLQPTLRRHGANADECQTLATSLQQAVSASSAAAPIITCSWSTRRLEGVTAKWRKYLDAAGITVNKKHDPFDPRPPLDPIGHNIGTPAYHTRHEAAEMKVIAAECRVLGAG